MKTSFIFFSIVLSAVAAPTLLGPINLEDPSLDGEEPSPDGFFPINVEDPDSDNFAIFGRGDSNCTVCLTQLLIAQKLMRVYL
jgi:hypothetical protein